MPWERAIEPFQERAFYLFAWRAWVVALVVIVNVIARDFDMRAALLICGKMALLFSLALVLYAKWLSDDRIVRIEPWRAIAPSERPAGAGGRRWAYMYVRDLSLRFAQGASTIAAAFLASALVVANE